MLDAESWPGVLEHRHGEQGTHTRNTDTGYIQGDEQTSNLEQKHSNDNGSRVPHCRRRVTHTKGGKMQMNPKEFCFVI